VEYIEKVISALQGRLVTLMDLPTAAPYFFVPPAWADAEASAMLDGISMEDYLNAMRGTLERLKSASSWNTQTLADALHAESRAEAMKPAKFMTALRHAMSGTKNGPSVAEIMDVLGEQRTIARLEEAGSSSHAWFTTTTSSSTHS